MKKYLVTFLVLGNLIGCLCYLIIPDELKYDYDNTWFTIVNPISYGSASAALFFGMYIFYGAIVLSYIKSGKSPLDMLSFEIHGWFLLVSGVLYLVHYLDIINTGTKERLSYTALFILVVYLKQLFNYKKTDKQ